MQVRRRTRTYEWVAVDINTQRDFSDRSGQHPIANLAQVLPAWRRLWAWIKWHGVPLVSSMDSHRVTEMGSHGHPVCCIDGSAGQRKLPFTMARRHLRVEFDNTLAVPLEPFETYQQILFRQRTDDLLSNPKAERFLNQVSTREFLVFGNVLELSVKAVALGLLTQEKKVAIVVDACGVWNADEADLAIRQLGAKGARITNVAEITARRPHERRMYHRLSESNGHSRLGIGTVVVRPRRTPAGITGHPQENGTSCRHRGVNGHGRLPQ